MNQINRIDQRKIKKKNETEKNMRKRVKREAAEWIEKREWRINGSTSLERPDTM
jgi:hypothetical protein